jgi:hypothetical protein
MIGHQAVDRSNQSVTHCGVGNHFAEVQVKFLAQPSRRPVFHAENPMNRANSAVITPLKPWEFAVLRLHSRFEYHARHTLTSLRSRIRKRVDLSSSDHRLTAAATGAGGGS